MTNPTGTALVAHERVVEAASEAAGWALCEAANGAGPGKCDIETCCCGSDGRVAARAAIEAYTKAMREGERDAGCAKHDPVVA